MAAGHCMVAYAAWWQGDFVEVRNHSRQGLALYDPDRHRAGITAYNQNPGIICGYLTALTDWALGYPSQAIRAMEKAVAHAKELQQPYSIGMTLLFSAQLSQLRREPEAARIRADEALEVSAEHGLHAVELWCLLPRGWAAAQLLLRQEGPGAAQAEGCIAEALAIARDQQAKSWELRAATNMARMWRDDGRLDDARALLSPVYSWFTEGFDTADLRDAKELLAQLS